MPNEATAGPLSTFASTMSLEADIAGVSRFQAWAARSSGPRPANPGHAFAGFERASDVATLHCDERSPRSPFREPDVARSRIGRALAAPWWQNRGGVRRDGDLRDPRAARSAAEVGQA